MLSFSSFLFFLLFAYMWGSPQLMGIQLAKTLKGQMGNNPGMLTQQQPTPLTTLLPVLGWSPPPQSTELSKPGGMLDSDPAQHQGSPIDQACPHLVCSRTEPTAMQRPGDETRVNQGPPHTHNCRANQHPQEHPPALPQEIPRSITPRT